MGDRGGELPHGGQALGVHQTLVVGDVPLPRPRELEGVGPGRRATGLHHRVLRGEMYGFPLTIYFLSRFFGLDLSVVGVLIRTCREASAQELA